MNRLPESLRLARHATVLVLGTPPADWLAELETVRQSIVEWDGRIVMLAERDARIDIAPPAIVIADQWGEVHVAESAANGAWYPVQKIEQTVRWLAIRCAG